MNPYSLLSFCNQLSSVCYTALLLPREWIIQSTAMRILRYSAGHTESTTCMLISQGEILSKYSHVSSHHLRESCCAWETQQRFHSAACQRLQHTVLCLQKRSNPLLWVPQVCNTEDVPLEHMEEKYHGNRGNCCNSVSTALSHLWNQWKRMKMIFFLARKEKTSALGRT